MKAWKLATCFTLLAAFSSPNLVQALDPIAILSPSDVPAGWGNGFGWSVAISGNYIVVGAPHDPWYNGSSTGAVYVFRRVGRSWIEQAKLTVSDGTWPDQLGYTVGIDGDVIVAGAPRAEWGWCGVPPGGAVYVFRRDDHGTPNDPRDDTWFQQARLTSPDPRRPLGLGASLAISGDVIVAGFYCGGMAEVFRWNANAWGHEQQLVGSDTQEGDGFGTAVAIDDCRIAAGAPWSDGRKGLAYIFKFNGIDWVHEDQLVPTDREGVGFFGQSVSLHGERAVCGAPGTNGVGFDDGAAYIFSNSGSSSWNELTKVTASDASRYGEFGSSISIERDLVVVGKTGHPWAYLARLDQFGDVETEKLLGLENSIGRSVAIEGKYAAVLSYVYAVRERRSLQDYLGFQNCFTGNIAADLSATCQVFDLTGDGRIDLSDFEDLAGTFVGP